MLEIINLNIDIVGPKGNTKILDDVSFSVPPQTIVGLLGPSGSGKTLTAAAIMGLLSMRARATISGKINFLENDLLNTGKVQLRKIYGKSIALVFQNPFTYFNPCWTIKRHFRELVNKSNFELMVSQAFRNVSLYNTKRLLESYPHQLSGGELQRLMFALATINRPKLIIADEPTTALDATLRSGVIKLLQSLKESQHLSILLISHDLNTIKKSCDQIYLLRNGKIRSIDKNKIIPEDLYPDESHVLNHSVKLIKDPVLDTTILRAKNITKFFGLNPVVQNASIELKKRECHAIVGESGSGKTTLGRILAGLQAPTNGFVYYQDQLLSGMNHKELSKIIQMIFQDPYTSLNPKMKILSILREPLILHSMKSNMDELIVRHLHDLNLDKSCLTKYPYQLSGGQLQRVCIARALLISPSILITDEPTSSVDVSLRTQIIDLLKELIHYHHISLVLITHDLETVVNIADTISVMVHGQILEQGSLSDILNHPVHPYTSRLLREQDIPLYRPTDLPDPNAWWELGKSWQTLTGCPFNKVCTHAEEICSQKRPFYQNYGTHHTSWCLYPVHKETSETCL
ncbi:MAG: ABC transporter ATP-binding protein [Chlamydiota bacterium]|nr:ABC transporter ATP-binding protein [Chlamydiota bacterium]